ncbi:MAG TPA: metallophosphoesterase [Candidatus Nanoarchaeia archaeon]|nr:metallophosphoesterase [Candidatus Nanoarchaeia archaeon]
MKLLAFADMHGNLKSLEGIAKRASSEKAEVIVCAGDFTVFERDIERILKKLNSIGLPVLVIPGNHESSEHISLASKALPNVLNFDNSMLEREEFIFVGREGNGFSHDDPRFRAWGERILKDLKKKKGKKVILITHAPPYGTAIDKISGQHCGNKDIRRFIEKAQPVLAISGHLHECAGKEDRVGKCRVINPGPYGKIISV